MKFNQLTCLLSICSLVILGSCGSDSGTTPTNSAPGSFSVTVSNIAATSATISWTESEDPDGDDVTYELFLGGVSQFTTSDLGVNVSQLTPNTEYNGEIVASDGNDGETSSSFNFTTEEEAPTGNQNPGSFSIEVSDITHNSAKLEWDASVDPDGDDVTYTIELEGSELASGETATSYDLTNLTSGESLAGTVTASDGNGGTEESEFDLTVYVVDISKYTSMNGYVSHELVDCNYTEGGSGKCYEIIFDSNPVNDDGPFCPATTSDVGGFGNYNGDGTVNGSATDGDAVGFSIMNAALFQAMENDGYDIIDGSGNIRISDFTGMDNPSFGYCLEPVPDDNLTLTFQIPVVPENLGTPDNIDNVEYIGLALDGVPINGEPPLVAGSEAQGEGKIPSLDRCGGHHDPAGYYHWHFIASHMDETLKAEGLYSAGTIECSNKTQSTTALVGYARDGYPIYSANDMDDSAPDDLDSCNGHEAATADYPEGIYHYHASTDIPNVPPCIVGKQAMDSFVKPN